MIAILAPIALAAAPAVSTAAAAIPVEARRAIDRANDDWLPAMRDRDAARIASAYADDGVLIGADGGAVRGRAAIEAHLAAMFAKMPTVTAATIVSEGAHREGDYIYEWGRGTLTLRPASGEAVTSAARYLSVWRRDTDGVWRIARNLSLR